MPTFDGVVNRLNSALGRVSKIGWIMSEKGSNDLPPDRPGIDPFEPYNFIRDRHETRIQTRNAKIGLQN